MNPTRYDALVDGLTAIAYKVFLVIPTDEAWPSKKVYSELLRSGASTRNLQIVEGCINSLVNIGLVKEKPRGMFMRLQPRATTIAEEPVVEDNPLSKPAIAEASLTGALVDYSILSDEEVATPEEPTTANELPYRIVQVPNTQKPDYNYEYYLNLRFERIENMLKLLSGHVDDDMGLALLELAEDLAETHSQSLDYREMLQAETETKIEVDEGWFMHDLGDYIVFTQNPTPPTIEEVELEEVPFVPYVQFMSKEELAAIPKENYDRRLEGEREWVDEVFRMFEPNGEGARPYYDSLLDKLKNHVPDIEPVAVTETPVEQEPLSEFIDQRKIRRGMCDIKIDGISQAPEYRAWMNIVSPSNAKAMAEEGLEVEETWQTSFKAFLQDIGYRPLFGARLMRIDRSIGWIKSNVEWRKGGQVVPARRQRPSGWPQLQARDTAERQLRTIVREATDKIRKL